ncbi:unnamed protein product [Ectocarpus sp. CCAP 1310/34]|nr:unnamed protein product [Ectocarpus sp. CCAP 1310/34]
MQTPPKHSGHHLPQSYSLLVAGSFLRGPPPSRIGRTQSVSSGLTTATAFFIVFIVDASVRTTAGSSWRQGGGVGPCRPCDSSRNCGRRPRRNSQQRPLDSVTGTNDRAISWD